MRAAIALLMVCGCASIVGLQDPQPGADGNGCNRACDIEDNCGCSATETCTWNQTSGDPYCRTSGGSAALGDQCDKDDACQIGTSCVFGVCRRYCVDSSPCGSTTCTADFTPYVPVKMCANDCTPITNDGCAGTSCLIIQGGDSTFCLAGDTIALGDPCDQAPFQCVPGAVCHDEGGAFKCRAQCDPGGAACASGTCTTAPDLIVRGTQYGVCM
ncbi:MAG TPA: hypothetical protein VL463_22285 [Kofleriaceae bacterium]|nr:hypothetical protein [Kofleriaceae bacterium]